LPLSRLLPYLAKVQLLARQLGTVLVMVNKSMWFTGKGRKSVDETRIFLTYNRNRKSVTDSGLVMAEGGIH